MNSREIVKGTIHYGKPERLAFAATLGVGNWKRSTFFA